MVPLDTMEVDQSITLELPDDIRSALGGDRLVYRVWGGDWCPDCQRELPPLAAALAAAGVGNDRIRQYPVQRTSDGTKQGDLMTEYDITRVPTVVVERDGRELVRFVEAADAPAHLYLGRRLRDLGTV